MSEEEQALVGQLGIALVNQAKAADWLTAMRGARDEAINQLRVLGWPIADCAEISGLSAAAISKIGDAGGIVGTRGARRVSA
jgi:hypothetical protein